ncbi:MAG TPA: pantoate--beta-alanine ligase [Spirochaetota bacterium]
MIVCRTIKEARDALRKVRKDGRTISFVPTMGALHDGHLSLIRRAKGEASFCVMSIFVNRIQFNDPRDFEKYPRDYDRDCDRAESAGCDLVFLPDDSVMYHNQMTYVVPEKLDAYLCGASRPGHFRGVCTVVTKLFNIIQPDIALFGQKDIQQAIILQKMTEDLNIPTTILIASIIRETEGLAMSSRNVLLSADERGRALSIYRALQHAESLIRCGERRTYLIEREAREIIERDGKPERIDYIMVTDYETLAPVPMITGRAVFAIAAYFGTTRLIDNMIISPGEKNPCVF